MAKHTNQWLLAIFSVLILGLIVWFVQEGISNRPIVSYKLEDCPSKLTLDYQGNLQESIGLGISNSGKTKSSVLLRFYGENLTILNETKKDYNQINGTEVLVRFTASDNSQTYYFGEKVHFSVNKSVDSFSYEYSVLDNSDLSSISNSISKLFGEIQGYYPTSCKYKKSSNSEFVKI